MSLPDLEPSVTEVDTHTGAHAHTYTQVATKQVELFNLIFLKPCVLRFYAKKSKMMT